jgi:hypothetical protein
MYILIVCGKLSSLGGSRLFDYAQCSDLRVGNVIVVRGLG